MSQMGGATFLCEGGDPIVVNFVADSSGKVLFNMLGV